MGLRVIQQFSKYNVGDLIPDGKDADAVLESEQAGYVIRVADQKADDKPTIFVTDQK